MASIERTSRARLARFLQCSGYHDFGIAMESTYLIRHHPATRAWLVERDGESVAALRGESEAIATAVEAAREEARLTDRVCRVSLVDDRGGLVPLTTFGLVVGRGHLLQRLARWNRGETRPDHASTQTVTP